jgi:single-strand DNA-binding protein
MNTFIGIGRITRDHEIKSTDKGIQVVAFSLAITRDKENTDFLNCVAFGKTAELLSTYTGKGSQIAVEGWVKTRSYEKDGKKVYTTEIIANRVQFLDSKKAPSEVSESVDEGLPW